MALDTVLKNVCTYLELLQTARCNKNLTWNVESFVNAFQWAAYCQKLHHQSSGKPYREDLNKEILRLSSLPWHLGDLPIDLDLFNSSIGLLALTLIQHDSVVANGNRLRMALEKTSADRALKKDLEDLLAVESTFKTLLSTSLISKEDQSSEASSIESSKLETTARTLVDHLRNIFSFSRSFNERIQKWFIQDKLHQLGSSNFGMTIIVNAFLLLFNCEDRIRWKKVLRLLDTFVSDRIKESDMTFWLSLPHSIVVEVCSCSEEFLKKFFADLTSTGNDFQIHYNKEIRDEASGFISLFEWRCEILKELQKSKPSMTYLELKNWVDLFLHGTGSECVALSTGKLVADLACRSEVNLWRTVCQDLDRIDLLLI